MATEVIDGDRVQRVFDELETQKNILSNCTQLFKSLSNHFTLLEQSIDDKSKSLFSKFATLESESKKTLEALEQRENSIPERESSAAARIEEQKEAALAEFEKTITGDAEFYEILKSYCRKMDCTGLMRFMISKRKESMSLKSVINVAIEESVDLPCLVLDAFEEFISQKSAKVGVPDKRWACGMLIQALFPNAESVEKSSPVFARSVIERAEGVLTLWKENLCENTEGGSMNGAEATMFLQMVAGFGLVSKFDLDFLRKLVLEFSSRKEMPKVAAAIGFGDKLGDIIDELVNTGKEIEAIHFASEAGLTERFPPISLLKSYLKNSKKNATTILKNGKNSSAAMDEAHTAELNSIKTIVKCVEDRKLESEFPLDSLKKRASQLEKTKADRKKSSSSSNKLPHKRSHGNRGSGGGGGNRGGGGGRGGGGSSRGGGGGSGRGGGGPHFRPPKAAKFSNSYSPFGRRNNNAPPPRHSPAPRYSGPYNYPSQPVYEYDRPTTDPYAAAYGAAHGQNPASVPPPQHYSLSSGEDMMGAAGGSYVGQTYGTYDYGNAAPPTYQTTSYTQ